MKQQARIIDHKFEIISFIKIYIIRNFNRHLKSFQFREKFEYNELKIFKIMNTKIQHVSSWINGIVQTRFFHPSEIYFTKVFLILRLERKTDRHNSSVWRLNIFSSGWIVVFLWKVDTTQSWPAISHTFDPMDSPGPFSIRRDAGETLHFSSSSSFSTSVLPVLRASYYLSIVSLVR